jgi:hypothetical protein
MKQTAVDYLWNDLIANPGNYIKAYQKAKAMEKEQIEDAWYAGDEDGSIHEFEQYYEQTYGSK